MREFINIFGKIKKQKGSLFEHLRNQGRKYRKREFLKDNRGIITEKIMLDKRPNIVEQRSLVSIVF